MFGQGGEQYIYILIWNISIHMNVTYIHPVRQTEAALCRLVTPW